MSMEYFIKVAVGVVLLVVIGYLLSLFELFTQISRYKSYWDNNNQDSTQAGEILYVALGDSTAQGIGASYPTKGYVGVIAEELARKKSKPIRVINLSKSGATIKQALEYQLPELEKLKINKNTIVTVEIGANDMASLDVKVFEKDMDHFMSRLPKQTLISDIPFFGGTRFSSRQANVEKANQIMSRLAAKYGFELVPLHERTKQNRGLKTIAIDLFHPSNYSYRHNWADVFLERIG